MGKNINIYISDEAVVSLEKKKKEGEFNLSAFVSTCLSKDFGKDGKSVDEINVEISKKKAQIQLLDVEIEELFNQMKDILQKKEISQKEQEEKDKWDQLKKDIENFSINQTDEDREEYRQGIKDGKWRSFTDFAKLKLGGKNT